MQGGLRGISSGQQADLIHFRPSGDGAKWKSVGDKLRERVHVSDFGAVGDGRTDDTKAVLAAIAAMKTAGGGEIYFSAKPYSVTDLTIDADCVSLIGAGSGRLFDGSSSQTGTILRARNGTTDLLTVAPPSTALKNISGARVENMVLDGNGIANRSLPVRMAASCVFRNLTCLGATLNQIETSAITGFAGLNYVYQSAFENIWVNAGAGNAKGIVLSGEPAGGGGNRTVFCMFRQIHITHSDGTALEINDADSNSFFNLAVSRNIGATGIGIDLIGTDADSQDLVHGNCFFFAHAGPGGWRAIGNKAINNWVFGLGTEDGSPVNISAGAQLRYIKDDGLSNRTWAVVAASGAAAASVTGTTAETTLATIPLAPSTMGKNGILRITTFWSSNNSANNKIPRVKLNTTSWDPSLMTRSAISQEAVAHIINRNSESAQIGYVSGLSGLDGVSGTALKTGTVNTANAQNLLITGQLTNTGDTLTLEAYFVEVLQRE